jgi:hypothetical protein
MKDGTDEPTPYEACVAELDRRAKELGRRIITHAEYEAKAYAALSEYFTDDRPEDDVALLLQYARLPIARLQDDPLDGDRAALDVFDRQLQGLLHYPATRISLGEQLDDIGRRIALGDGDAVDELRTLCRDGWREQPHVFMFRSNVETALRTAADLGVVDALVDAVSPSATMPGQLGGHDVFGGFGRRLTFDLLAVLAVVADATGDAAVQALVDLCGFLDTAGPAAVRLPVHRLSHEQRTTLHGHLESVAELLGRDPFLTPTHDTDRIVHVLRSVLWLANDAANLD